MVIEAMKNSILNKKMIEALISNQYDTNQEMFNKFFNGAIVNCANEKEQEMVKTNKRVLEYIFFNANNPIDKINYLFNNCKKQCSDIHKFEHIYKLLKESERESLEVADLVVRYCPKDIKIVYGYLNTENRRKLVEKHYLTAYKQIRELLSNNEVKYIVNIVKQTDEFYLYKDSNEYSSGIQAIMLKYKSNFLDKLKKIYGASYFKNTGRLIDDDDAFVYAILSSNALRDIYISNNFTYSDTLIISAILTHFKEKEIDTQLIRKRLELIKKENELIEKEIYNNIITKQRNTDILENYLNSINVNKNNFFKFVISRKYLDRTLKESLLIALAKHYKTSFMSPIDIIDFITEAQNRNISLFDLIEDKEIERKIFRVSYGRLKTREPEIYNLIESGKEKMPKNAKLMVKLYEAIPNENIYNYNEFFNRYKRTPEQVLTLLDGTSLYEKVYEQIITWYDFNQGIKRERINTQIAE